MKQGMLVLSSIAGISVGLVGISAGASPTQWAIADGGNGHYYDVVAIDTGYITWTDARAAAEQAGGYLATVTSAVSTPV